MSKITNHANIQRLAVCAMLTALGVVFKMFSIPLNFLGSYSMDIGFALVPVILAAVLYGPLYGGCVSALVDLLAALLMPKGPFVPWFTIVALTFGLVPGLFFAKNQPLTFIRLLIAVAIGQLIGSVILNTTLLNVLYDLPFQKLFVARLIEQIVNVPLFTLLVFSVVRLLESTNIIKKIKA